MKQLKLASVVVCIVMLVGCSATQTAIKKRSLEVSSKTSTAVILEPVAPEKRIAYVRVRDVSGEQFDLKDDVINAVRSKGIQVTQNPEKANFMLTATILQAGKTTANDVNSALSAGFSGALIGAGGAALTGGSNNQVAAFGLAGAAAGFLADTLIDDVYYSVVVDVEMRERPLQGDSMVAGDVGGYKRQSNNTAATTYVKRGDNYKWITHQTRVVTTANQVNLQLEEAMPEIRKDLSNILSNMFE